MYIRMMIPKNRLSSGMAEACSCDQTLSLTGVFDITSKPPGMMEREQFSAHSAVSTFKARGP